METLEGKELLEHIRQQPCIGCRKGPKSDPSHITSRGAGGKDTHDNVVPMCRTCHTMWHYSGISKYLWKHPHVKEWLMQKGRFDVIQKLQKTARRD